MVTKLALSDRLGYVAMSLNVVLEWVELLLCLREIRVQISGETKYFEMFMVSFGS